MSYKAGNITRVVSGLACTGEERTFKDERAQKRWTRLHDMKCEICRNLVEETAVNKYEIHTGKYDKNITNYK